MRRGTLLWAIFVPLLAILLATLILVTGLSGRATREFFLKRTSEQLESLATVAAPGFLSLATAGDMSGVQALCASLKAQTGVRFTIVLADGRVIGDSQNKPELLDNHGDRPEFAAALAGGTGRSTRFSRTLGHQQMYVAVPAGRTAAGEILIVRTSVSLQSLDGQMREIYRQFAVTGMVMALLAAAISYLLSRSLGRALGRLRAGAEAFAAGDLSRQLAVADTIEIAAVTEAMNRMAGQLGERLATTERQRNELEAVLKSMVEGVLAVDARENVIGLNRVGGLLLGQEPARAVGRSVQEVGHHPELTRLTQQVLRGAEPLETDIRIGTHSDTWLQVRASGLIDTTGILIGALLVMNDVTRLRKLENMRRDFVANVSHELKTPITSIKGFVETILDDPPTDAAELQRFLLIVNRQADRLDSIITDLLSLSRLEQDTETGGIERSAAPLAPLLARVVRDFEARRPDQPAQVRLECADGLEAPINAALVEQAVANLVDNALKYSPLGSPVAIICKGDATSLRIAVTDAGPGIGAEHLPRLFERFYRVDKARSRQMGGTGLGLAIVKHIAQAHGGHAEVASEVGRGSTFTIVLPGAETS